MKNYKSFKSHKKELSFDDLLPWGPYKGYTLELLLSEDPEYLKYACDELDLQIANDAFEYLQLTNPIIY